MCKQYPSGERKLHVMATMDKGSDRSEEHIEVSRPHDYAVGIPAIMHSMGPALRRMGVSRSAKLLTSMNQRDGFDCMSCAWPDPTHRKTAEFCESGARAVTWEADPLTVPASFWSEHSVSDLATRSEYWLGQQGRLVEPVYKPAGGDHYEPVSWVRAFSLVAERLTDLDSPDEAAFYTSGRASNEAAFVYQLFARAFGTNNLPDCSNMCHESTGAALGEAIGVGKSTINYDDFERAQLIIIMGQNPGTNHPRMLTALEEAKQAGTKIIAINPLPEAAFSRYKNPQTARGLAGRGTPIADEFLQIRLSGDMALMQAVSKRVLEAEDRAPGTVLDHAFLERHCQGLGELRAHLDGLDEATVLASTGLTSEQIDRLTEAYIASDRTIVTWAMGLTQHKKAVDTIKEIMNLLLLRGNIGKPGAGASPIRGHSNVQGDRTMGIWEKMDDAFLDALQREFHFDPPRAHGLDSVKAIRAALAGKLRVWVSLGGNVVGSVSDTAAVERAMNMLDMTVQVSTKLNRSHTVVGREALILPTMGRTEIDRQVSGEQYVTVEDTVCAVHPSWGRVEPVSPNLLSETAIVCRLARAVLGDRVPIDWAGFEDDYDRVRDHIANVVPGCDAYNEKTRVPGGYVLPHPPRDTRTFPTPSGKAVLTVNHLEHVERPLGRPILQTVRAHDQFNTTIYSLNDRYRGVHHGREVVFVNPADLTELGLVDGQLVDVHSEYADGVDRAILNYRVVSYPTARGCAAAYFPEANALIPLDAVAEVSNTPVSKSCVVRLEPSDRSVVV